MAGHTGSARKTRRDIRNPYFPGALGSVHPAENRYIRIYHAA
jgi:hypothetical protein